MKQWHIRSGFTHKSLHASSSVSCMANMNPSQQEGISQVEFPAKDNTPMCFLDQVEDLWEFLWGSSMRMKKNILRKTASPSASLYANERLNLYKQSTHESSLDATVIFKGEQILPYSLQEQIPRQILEGDVHSF